MFNFYISEYEEEGFNCDLTENNLGVILGKKFHLGLTLNKDNLDFTIQNPKKTYSFTLCYSKKEFNRLTKRNDAVIYKKTF